MSKLHAVMYTDGSAQPNPGPYGGGCHGYLYTDKDIKKNNDKPNHYTITTRGYLEKQDIQPADTEVKPTLYYNAAYAYGPNGTNNKGELQAVIDTIDIICSNHTVEDILIYTDSSYVLSVHKGVTTIKDKSWDKPDRANVELWRELDNVLNEYYKDTKITLAKITAHGTAIGNNLADRLAFAAREMSAKNVKEKLFKFYEGKYWKDKPTPHPMLNFRQVYFNVGFIPSDSEHLYTIMDYPKDVEIGKKSASPIFGITVFKESVREIDDLVNIYLEKMNGLQVLSAISLPLVYSQNNYKLNQLLNEHTYNMGTNKRLSILGEEEVVTPILPAGLAQNALHRTLAYYKYYKNYINNINEGELVYIDISDYFFKVNDKNKLVCVVDNVEKVIPVDVDIAGHKHTIKLYLGLDTLTRNQFKRLEKENPKVVLILDQKDPKRYDYQVLVDTDKATGIYGNYYVNQIYLK